MLSTSIVNHVVFVRSTKQHYLSVVDLAVSLVWFLSPSLLHETISKKKNKENGVPVLVRM